MPLAILFEQLWNAALANGQSLLGADRGQDAWRVRQGRRRSLAFAERRGAVGPRGRLAGGDSVKCRRRR